MINHNLSHQQWTGKTGGYTWMQKSLILLVRYTNLRILYAVMAFVIPFYMLLNHKEYVAIYHFFRERFNHKPLKSFWNSYLNHFVFGQIILDRFAVYAGKQFEIEFDGYEHFENLVKQEKGFIQLSSHVGNYELAGYSLISENKRFNALVFSGETKTVMNNRNRVFTRNNIRLIPIETDMSHLFTINNALNDGEIVSMAGDRIFGSQKNIKCKFFGEDAKFPSGPFTLAVQKDVVLLSVFVMKKSVKRYKIIIRPICETKETSRSRKEKAEDSASLFAAQLEHVIKEYPTQWFNYFEFWKQ